MTNPLQVLADAIGKAEGYGVSGAIPTTANNPGDLVLGDVGYGTMGAGVTVFPSPAAGNNALLNQLGKIQSGTSKVYNPNQTLSQIGNTWSGGDSNWAANVSKTLGVSPSSTFGSILSSLPALPSMSSIMQSGSSILGASTLGAGLFSFLTKQSTDANGNKTSSLSFDVGRIVAVILGLMLVGAGVMAFKQTSVVISKTANLAAKGAELAA